MEHPTRGLNGTAIKTITLTLCLVLMAILPSLAAGYSESANQYTTIVLTEQKTYKVGDEATIEVRFYDKDALKDPDDGKFKLWYRQPVTGDPLLDDVVMCYAESDDALHWHRPLSEKCISFKDHRATNIVKDDIEDPGVVLNHNRNNPDRKFLLYSRSKKASRERGLRRPRSTRGASAP